jgi:thiamine kinase-like enzyme
VRRVKPDFLHDAAREARVYETLLTGENLGTAAFHGAADGFLLLENVDATPLWQVDDLEMWSTVARWLAGFHRRFAALDDEQARALGLVRYDRPFLRLWLERARSFVPHGPLDHIARAHETAVEQLASVPRTLVHGELYPSNVLIGAAPDGIRVCPIDWETAGLGPGIVDLAALVTGWSSQVADALAEAYREEAGDVDRRSFERTLRCGRLHLALRWLGWSASWSPPPEHRRDWLEEAFAMAEELAP